ncbi:polysaccharide biosynthesis/export family protein [Enterovirga rhinocerotis]|uniref:Polysaccharide export outer membrane protein n=1 Tax=Enterovirga rhinocerotis TaxID=1339210 RepID=A0A4R7BXD7_9HYPH|nr:polysaccharide biosynthesis/export family protein [Enterovirga rhinocerotis]TDR89882.1 polysaccharide export outer membrane protein [Enterovirga rhinocerotis]
MIHLRTTARVLGIAALLCTAGCSTLPTTGPTTDQVVSNGDNPNERRYVITDLDERVVSILNGLSGPSLRARFGDYRPAPENRIGVGDEVRINIWEAAAGGLFSGPPSVPGQSSGARMSSIPDQVVGRDGAVTVPYAGRIQVSGRSPQAVEQVILERLAGKAIEPQVLVTVSRNISNSVTVTGEVTSGARIPLSARGDRILDAVAAAGGVRGAVHESFVRLTRGQQTVTMPMETILANPQENVALRGGDIITVVREPQTYTAFGAVGQQTVVPFGRITLSLEEAVAKAGGLLDFRADPDGVFLLRFEPPSTVRAIQPGRAIDARERLIPVVYRLTLRDAKSYFLARSFRMRDKDTLYVANASAAELQKFLNLIGSLTAPITSGARTANAF